MSVKKAGCQPSARIRRQVRKGYRNGCSGPDRKYGHFDHLGWEDPGTAYITTVCGAWMRVDAVAEMYNA